MFMDRHADKSAHDDRKTSNARKRVFYTKQLGGRVFDEKALPYERGRRDFTRRK